MLTSPAGSWPLLAGGSQQPYRGPWLLLGQTPGEENAHGTPSHNPVTQCHDTHGNPSASESNLQQVPSELRPGQVCHYTGSSVATPTPASAAQGASWWLRAHSRRAKSRFVHHEDEEKC
jgi:hypothetical protein